MPIFRPSSSELSTIAWFLDPPLVHIMPDPEITMPTFTVRESSRKDGEKRPGKKTRPKKKSLAGDNYAILIHRMTRLLSIVVSYRVVSRMVRISSSVEPSSIHPANAMRAVIKKDIEINETDEANKKKCP